MWFRAFRGRLLAVMFFLLPGRYVVQRGDVAQICVIPVARGAYEAIECSPLLGQHPLLVEMLADRYREVRARSLNEISDLG